jgi:hypothetical protein
MGGVAGRGSALARSRAQDCRREIAGARAGPAHRCPGQRLKSPCPCTPACAAGRGATSRGAVCGALARAGGLCRRRGSRRCRGPIARPPALDRRRGRPPDDSPQAHLLPLPATLLVARTLPAPSHPWPHLTHDVAHALRPDVKPELPRPAAHGAALPGRQRGGVVAPVLERARAAAAARRAFGGPMGKEGPWQPHTIVHKHTRARARRANNTHTHIYWGTQHEHTHSCTCTHTHTDTHTHTHTHTHGVRAHTHTHAHAHSCINTLGKQAARPPPPAALRPRT